MKRKYADVGIDWSNAKQVRAYKTRWEKQKRGGNTSNMILGVMIGRQYLAIVARILGAA
jgi:hypothetical protein